MSGANCSGWSVDLINQSPGATCNVLKVSFRILFWQLNPCYYTGYDLCSVQKYYKANSSKDIIHHQLLYFFHFLKKNGNWKTIDSVFNSLCDFCNAGIGRPIGRGQLAHTVSLSLSHSHSRPSSLFR